MMKVSTEYSLDKVLLLSTASLSHSETFTEPRLAVDGEHAADRDWVTQVSNPMYVAKPKPCSSVFLPDSFQ